ncbi:hypothetical protein LOK49_LG14G00444 [Camellia lanceoleosa]|uniref:Uncharacterized protein n=1 Tax=Camellia lanceoleosa TaxID=1840588 RepID=A0ACC0FE65_9ERIC|nr:hypothetical protein LOK49_LG14G00444 [Camellia lanceoleosa]
MIALRRIGDNDLKDLGIPMANPVSSLCVCGADLNPSSFVESMEGLTSDIIAMNEREKGVASLGLSSVEVAQGDPFRRVTQSKPFEE